MGLALFLRIASLGCSVGKCGSGRGGRQDVESKTRIVEVWERKMKQFGIDELRRSNFEIWHVTNLNRFKWITY